MEFCPWQVYLHKITRTDNKEDTTTRESHIFQVTNTLYKHSMQQKYSMQPEFQIMPSTLSSNRNSLALPLKLI